MKQPPTKQQYNRAAAQRLHYDLSASQSAAERSESVVVLGRVAAVHPSTPLSVTAEGLSVTGVNTRVPLNRDSIDDDYILKYKVKVKKIN